MPHSNCDHTIHGRHHHGWDNSIAPALTIAPGESIHFECRDSSGGQFTPESTTADVPSLDVGKINPVTGPVVVDGAEPGDVL
jgi:acetamidase/formamidase